MIYLKSRGHIGCSSVYDKLRRFDVHFINRIRFSKKAQSPDNKTFSREHQEHTPDEGNSVSDDPFASGSFRSPLHYKFLSRVGDSQALVRGGGVLLRQNDQSK